MEQIERIAYMEQILDEGLRAVSAGKQEPESLRATGGRLQELFDYYHSPLWLQDLDDDRAGLLPADLKRGVLSEDAVWELESWYYALIGSL